MTKTTIAGLALCLVAAPHAGAQNADRLLRGVTQNGNTLDIATSDGRYLVKPYSSSIVETTFIPNGERVDAASHAVILAPGQVPVTLLVCQLL